jgi:hypothetical protein
MLIRAIGLGTLEENNVKCCAVVVLVLALSLASNATGHSPLKLIKVISHPGIKKGLDHVAIDKKRDHRFSSAGKSVDVFDVKTGNHLASLLGLDRPHSVLYREDADRIFVVEGTEIAGVLLRGFEVQVLPINVVIRDLRFDSVSKRLYANCGGPPQGCRGSVDIFKQLDANHYEFIGSVATGLAARNGILVDQAARCFVGVPAYGTSDAQILCLRCSR